MKRLLDEHPTMCMVDLHSHGEHILHPTGHAPNPTELRRSAWFELVSGYWHLRRWGALAAWNLEEAFPGSGPRAFLPIRDLSPSAGHR